MTRHDRTKAEEAVQWIASATAMRRMARRMAIARRSLNEVLPRELVHDPCLDILLAIYQADDAIAASNLAFYTTVVPVVADRWLKVLCSESLVEVIEGRVTLTPVGVSKMETMLTTVIEHQLEI